MPPRFNNSKPNTRRLEKALQNHGLEKLRTAKRKADETLQERPNKTTKVSRNTGNESSNTSEKIHLHRARYAAARRTAMAIFNGGYGREIAMRVFDAVYEHGTYDPAAVGLQEKPAYNWSDPNNSHLDSDVIDQIWAWKPRYRENHEEIEMLSPKSRSRFV